MAIIADTFHGTEVQVQVAERLIAGQAARNGKKVGEYKGLSISHPPGKK